MKRSLVETGKFLALVLRHRPGEAGIELDEHGWADVPSLLKGMSITMDTLEEIVRTDSKGRYSFNDDHTLVRANQGHSVPVDVELESAEPPEFLFHGTAKRFLPSINEKGGLLPMSRLYVHLSDDPDVALEVGMRHGDAIVLSVKSGDMHREGIDFFRSVNGVWLVKEVPLKFLGVKALAGKVNAICLSDAELRNILFQP